MIRVAVVGASGRMGTEACAAVGAADDLELVAALGSSDDPARLAGADVAVDLTRPDAVLGTLERALGLGVPAVVVGTSGMTGERLDAVRALLDRHPAASVLVVPNFSVGAVLLTRFAAQAARFYESVEIVELHHPGKLDAPSGTARRTAQLVAQARREAGLGELPDATVDDPDGARGARVDGIPVHAVRLRGMVASEEVLLGAPGEALTLRHDSFDRASFMPGLLLAVRRVRERPGLTVGLEAYLDLG
ncbi:4-hydroxy-tetrahydrodipicolinate reductase [Motilibacter peucedani]|uniref:4-hydroxy-tetrahydrodipicolinate reductase n=1 Tax=Motilibacter peucedani TaxID=598650 RepID=A0A420XRE2_9ACTN|nr:4-hydroxy-tetrahydrodipicolinate reductase [Motilibacter peucedani]RKS77412.1 4-hydroxy-tetrahydrodipicolinate reductase [Motilibacter peucedani]